MKQSLVLFLSSCGALLISMANNVQADSATWSSNPGSGFWPESTNWIPNTIPNGPADIATFGISSVTDIAVPAGDFEVNSLVFSAGASAYTIVIFGTTGPTVPRFIISGAGIVNSSGITQNFAIRTEFAFGRLTFLNSASAGSMTRFTNGRGCSIGFADSATASYATFINQGNLSPVGFPRAIMGFGGNSSAGHSTIINTAEFGAITVGAVLVFFENSTAAEASITNEGTADEHGLAGARTSFEGNSTAGSAIITSHGAEAAGGGDGGHTTFFDSSAASKATLIADGAVNGAVGGKIIFNDDSTGGISRVEIFGNGSLDISGHNVAGVTIGSLEGDGLAFLGANSLAVGTNHRSTIFSGSIQDGGANGGLGGSLTKVGLGVLALSGSNTYTGPTTVNAGKLLVDGSINSAVTVNGGALGGSGTTKSVTVNSGGALSPGKSASILDVRVDSAGEVVPDGAGILHVTGDVVLTLNATYLVDLKGSVAGNSYDQLDVIGIVNLGNATLALSLAFKPAIGDVFTIINNDADDMIGGTFNGLAEGDHFTVDGETFSISYHGGDGNDVTLTSVAHKRRSP